MKISTSNIDQMKVLHPLLVRWEFPSSDWVKINTDGAARGYPGLATCGGIFRGSMKEFIGAFFVFLEVQSAMIAEFYGVIHAIKEAQKMGLTNVWLECDSALVCATFTVRTNVLWMFRNREILILITVRKSGLGLLIFFMKGMCVLVSWLI